jgi:hypothetical protein
VLVTVNSRKSRGQRKRTIKKQQVNFGPMALRFVTITVLALLTLVYLVQSTKGSTKRIEVTKMEDKKAILQDERQEIELEAIRLRAIQKLKDNKITDLEPVDQVENLSNQDN